MSEGAARVSCAVAYALGVLGLGAVLGLVLGGLSWRAAGRGVVVALAGFAYLFTFCYVVPALLRRP